VSRHFAKLLIVFKRLIFKTWQRLQGAWEEQRSRRYPKKVQSLRSLALRGTPVEQLKQYSTYDLRFHAVRL
jgi:hypothetical protein